MAYPLLTKERWEQLHTHYSLLQTHQQAYTWFVNNIHMAAVIRDRKSSMWRVYPTTSSSTFLSFSHVETVLAGGDEGTSSSESGESDDEPDQTVSRRWLLCCFKGNYMLNEKYRSLLSSTLMSQNFDTQFKYTMQLSFTYILYYIGIVRVRQTGGHRTNNLAVETTPINSWLWRKKFTRMRWPIS